jgi:hypothetical protein
LTRSDNQARIAGKSLRQSPMRDNYTNAATLDRHPDCRRMLTQIVALHMGLLKKLLLCVRSEIETMECPPISA